MKKAFGQTVRDLKREVNKKVLKVPSIEQKVLDATSNEPWGPHGTLLAEIAQASKNYHEYQIIMAVIWKRINDTGKNWRHVYKALTVLEYLVANGSERVIDEIREHAYQIQTLSDFQYIDSSGRDQGNNVRKKSQSLVVLVNDKERIHEVRQKAAANREKYHNTSTGGMYRPGSHSNLGGYGGYDDDRYGSRDEDRNDYGREREWGNRDDDRHGRYGNSYGHDGDRYGRDYEDRYGRDGYRDEDYHGRSRSVEDNQYGSRSRSSDRDRGYEDDGQYSSRGSGERADDQSQDGSTAGRRFERKVSEQNLGAPPSYEDAVGDALSPTHGEQGELPSTHPPKSSSPPASASPGLAANTSAPKPVPASPPASGASPPATCSSPLAPSPPVEERKEVESFDEFDPRGSFSAVPASSHVSGSKTLGGAETDLLGSLSDSLALVPATSVAPETDASGNSNAVPFLGTSSASLVPSQTFDDPFGDGPFKVIPSADNLPAQPQNISSTSSFGSSLNQTSENAHLTAPKAESVNSFGDAFLGANLQYSQQEQSIQNQEIDILADILPPTGPQPLGYSQATYPAPTGLPSPQVGFPPQNPQTPPETGFFSQPGPTAGPPASFPTHAGQTVRLAGFPAQSGQSLVQTNFQAQSGQLVPQHFYAQTTQSVSLTGFPAQAGLASQTGFSSQTNQPTPVRGFPSQMVSSPQAGFHSQSTQHNANFYASYNPQMGSTGPVTPQMTSQVSNGPAVQNNSVNFLSQSSSATLASSHMNPLSSPVGLDAPAVSQSIVPASTVALAAVQPAKDKFETKSTVWADTLSRGLVNLNISGSKINPLSDIGIDFDAINRKEKRMEKPMTAPVTSTITMGKAMGSGSGIGRAGAGALRPASNQMMGSGMGMGLGAGAGPGMGMEGYGANQPMGMNMNSNMGMGMGMGQRGQMQRPIGFPPGAAMPSGYNPMMGAGNYGQQPYGGGYQ